jgi:hypothetical protein
VMDAWTEADNQYWEKKVKEMEGEEARAKTLFDENNMREATHECCASCKHMYRDLDGDFFCDLVKRELQGEGFACVRPLNVCDKYREV